MNVPRAKMPTQKTGMSARINWIYEKQLASKRKYGSRVCSHTASFGLRLSKAAAGPAVWATMVSPVGDGGERVERVDYRQGMGRTKECGETQDRKE